MKIPSVFILFVNGHFEQNRRLFLYKMNCKHIRKRSYKNQIYFYCGLKEKNIDISKCSVCKKKDYKKYKPISKVSKKQAKEERERKSIFTNDMKHCFYCKNFKGIEIKKDDIHEIFGGRNRTRSKRAGFVVPLCRKCHENKEILKELKIYAQKEFEKTNSRSNFIILFDKSVLK